MDHPLCEVRRIGGKQRREADRRENGKKEESKDRLTERKSVADHFPKEERRSGWKKRWGRRREEEKSSRRREEKAERRSSVIDHFLWEVSFDRGIRGRHMSPFRNLVLLRLSVCLRSPLPLRLHPCLARLACGESCQGQAEELWADTHNVPFSSTGNYFKPFSRREGGENVESSFLSLILSLKERVTWLLIVN